MVEAAGVEPRRTPHHQQLGRKTVAQCRQIAQSAGCRYKTSTAQRELSPPPLNTSGSGTTSHEAIHHAFARSATTHPGLETCASEPWNAAGSFDVGGTSDFTSMVSSVCYLAMSRRSSPT